MNVAIILAGGVGKRASMGRPKQLVKVLGKPVIAYTLERFEHSRLIDAIEIVCHPDTIDEIGKIVSYYGISKVKWFVTGGETFQQSTLNGVMNLRDKIAKDDIVLLSFAVSPMVTDDIIEDAISVCRERGNAIPTDEMVMCTCIRDEDGLGASKGILRESIGGFNGPWTFKYDFVRNLYERAKFDGILEDLEPHTTSIALHYGNKLYFSKSATTNIKITRPEDFDVFEGLLLVDKRREAGKQREDEL